MARAVTVVRGVTAMVAVVPVATAAVVAIAVRVATAALVAAATGQIVAHVRNGRAAMPMTIVARHRNSRQRS